MMNGQAYDRKEALSRTEALIGSRALAILQESTVAVFGLGGVGGHAAEALARSGAVSYTHLSISLEVFSISTLVETPCP